MKGSILVENYEIVVCHGVNPEEKTTPQRFWVSVALQCDITEAANSDDIGRTISYSAVCKLIKSVFGQEGKNLLEHLATVTARRIMLEYPSADSVEVTVKKPDAPMKGVFDWVGVTARVKRSVAYLSMGSSLGDRDAAMMRAVDMLRADPLVLSVTESTRLATAPYGGVAENEFLNSALRVETLHTADSLLALLHRIENECGRVRKKRWGDRTLDLDIVFFDDEVRQEGDLVLPHPDMQNRDFVLRPLAEIAPYAVHPLYGKRVCDLLAELEERNGRQRIRLV